jgi:hypothetical protein
MRPLVLHASSPARDPNTAASFTLTSPQQTCPTGCNGSRNPTTRLSSNKGAEADNGHMEAVTILEVSDSVALSLAKISA